MILIRHFEGYGAVAAVTASDSCRFIYLAGNPPDSLRETCEGLKDELKALQVGAVQEGLRWRVFADSVRVDSGEKSQPKRGVSSGTFQNLLNLVFKWSHTHSLTDRRGNGR